MRSGDAPLISDLILGVLGAIIGGFIASLLGVGPRAGESGLELVLINLVIATVGAIILIAIRRALVR
ncbi:MAG: GlsB/YeaQ/YmgE family stress response membrane protein [Blastochloris sp.]|nr:GlsB/YeaQ/YmgE family stress response membrane protein [Blastochloris sp.]